MWFGISLFISVVVLIVGAIIAAIVFIMNFKKNEGAIGASDLLKMYLYFVSLITLVGIVLGGSMLIKAGLSYTFGYQFSYNTMSREMITPAYAPDGSVTYNKGTIDSTDPI